MSADPSTESGTRELVRHSEREVAVMPLLSDEELQRTWKLAQMLSASRMFKDATQAEQALAKILLGRDLGLSPTQAMTGIHIVEGKPEIAATTLAGFVRRRADMRYHVVEQTNDACEIHFFHVHEPGGAMVAYLHSATCPATGGEADKLSQCHCRYSVLHEGEEFLGSSRFDNEDVKRAGLDKETRSGHPSNHTKYPRNMKFARAMSNGIKWFVPEATGGIPVYHEGELERPALPQASEPSAPVELPEPIRELFEKARSLDSHRWRKNELLARLPHPNADTYVPTVDGIMAELQQWLSQVPVDAEAVEESIEDGEAHHAFEERYRADEAFRNRVDGLLSRRADLEAVDSSDVNDQQWQEIGAELVVVEGELSELGVPSGWMPSSEDRAGAA